MGANRFRIDRARVVHDDFQGRRRALFRLDCIRIRRLFIKPLKILVFGAHPDDAELNVGGCAAMWSAQGHKVKFVSTTNGDVGHALKCGKELAEVRKKEVEAAAEVLGIETEVMDVHDGELMPTLENRKLIKMFKPFNDPHKKYYITYDAKPAKEIQGGIWYSNGEQDDGAVAAMEMILLGKRGLMNTLYKKKGCTWGF